MAKPHLYIIAGHGAGDSGATGKLNGKTYQEQERVRKLADRIEYFGGPYVSLHPFSDNPYASQAILRLKIPKTWQLAELHMDSANQKEARGGHVIVDADLKPDKYDIALAKFIWKEMFPGRALSDGISRRNDLQNPNLAQYRGYSYRLIENGFISSPEDLAKFNANIDKIAKGYLKAFDISPCEIYVTVKPCYTHKGYSFAKSSRVSYLKKGQKIRLWDVKKADSGRVWGTTHAGNRVCLTAKDGTVYLKKA